MKITVTKHKKISPFIDLYCANNKTGKMVLNITEKKHFDTTDLYALQKLGFEIIEKK